MSSEYELCSNPWVLGTIIILIILLYTNAGAIVDAVLGKASKRKTFKKIFGSPGAGQLHCLTPSGPIKFKCVTRVHKKSTNIQDTRLSDEVGHLEFHGGHVEKNVSVDQCRLQGWQSFVGGPGKSRTFVIVPKNHADILKQRIQEQDSKLNSMYAERKQLIGIMHDPTVEASEKLKLIRENIMPFIPSDKDKRKDEGGEYVE